MTDAGQASRIPARPTIYRGIRMRSRLEARAAASFDRHGIAWDYESFAFGSTRGQYLPDFVVRTPGPRTCLVEMKGSPDRETLVPTLAQMAVAWDSDPGLVLVLDLHTPGPPIRMFGTVQRGRPRWVVSRVQREIGGYFCEGCPACASEVAA